MKQLPWNFYAFFFSLEPTTWVISLETMFNFYFTCSENPSGIEKTISVEFLPAVFLLFF